MQMYSALVNPSNASNVFTTIMETEGKTRKEKQSNSKDKGSPQGILCWEDV